MMLQATAKNAMRKRKICNNNELNSRVKNKHDALNSKERSSGWSKKRHYEQHLEQQ